MTEHDRFLFAKEAINDTHSRHNIGTYKERSQHLFLKCFYEPDVSYHEVPIAGYIADIQNEEGITEIQTAGFRALHDKLTVFLPLSSVTVVYPIQSISRVVWLDQSTGETSTGRYTSYPKAHYRIFSELLSIAEYLGHNDLSIHLVYLTVSKIKALDGYGEDKKKKASKLDSVPEKINSAYVINSVEDVRTLFPFDKGEMITSAEISKKTGLKRMALWRSIKFLTLVGVIVPSGKRGNAVVYEVI